MKNSMVFITPCIPDKHGVGWEQRAYSFLSAYAELYRIHLWFQPTNDNGNLKRLRPAFDLVESAYAFDERFIVQDTRGVGNLVAALKKVGLVHVFRLERILERLTHPGIVWDLDEIPYELRAAERNAGLPVPSTEIVASSYRRFETCWKKSRVVISSSPEERHPVLGVPKVVPNVTRLGEKRAKLGENREILFVGNLNKDENLDGLTFFVEQCMPLLPGDVSLVVVGRSPRTYLAKKKLYAIEAARNVKLFRDVEDCDPFYRRSRLVVVPLQQGAGIKLKLLEAFGQHCPVVTTTKGIEGLDVVDGREAIVRDDPGAFANACKTLLDDEQLSMSLANNAYRLIDSSYSQSHVDKLLPEILALRR